MKMKAYWGEAARTSYITFILSTIAMVVTWIIGVSLGWPGALLGKFFILFILTFTSGIVWAYKGNMDKLRHGLDKTAKESFAATVKRLGFRQIIKKKGSAL